MNSNREIILSDVEPKELMTSEEYRNFCEKMYKEIKPIIDRNNLARAQSERDAMYHFIG